MYMHIKQKQKTIFNSNLITKNVSHGSGLVKIPEVQQTCY